MTRLLQLCLTLCDPIDSSPPGSTIPGILQARTLEWFAIFFSNAWKWKVNVKLLSHVWLFMTPRTAAYQAPLSMGFSRQEHWSGLPLPSPGRTDDDAETPILWPPDAKNWLIGKDPDAGKDWRREGKGMTEDEIVGWHHRQDGHESEYALGVGDGQGNLVCWSPEGRRESDTTEWLNCTESLIMWHFVGFKISFLNSLDILHISVFFSFFVSDFW